MTTTRPRVKLVRPVRVLANGKQQHVIEPGIYGTVIEDNGSRLIVRLDGHPPLAILGVAFIPAGTA